MWGEPQAKTEYYSVMWQNSVLDQTSVKLPSALFSIRRWPRPCPYFHPVVLVWPTQPKSARILLIQSRENPPSFIWVCLQQEFPLGQINKNSPYPWYLLLVIFHSQTPSLAINPHLFLWYSELSPILYWGLFAPIAIVSEWNLFLLLYCLALVFFNKCEIVSGNHHSRLVTTKLASSSPW